MENQSNIIKGIVLSQFDDDGPNSKIYWPEDMEESSRFLIAMKTISLLMGDSVYQDGTTTEGVNYFGILPFPGLGLNGLTYFFLIYDPKARGNAKAATITILIDEENRGFFYENMKYLRVIMDNAAMKIQTSKSLETDHEIINEFKGELFEFTKEIEDPLSLKRQIKILFVGLDQAGKTSFLLAVKKRYSEIIKALPTKGVSRTDEKIFSEQNSQISIWDIGGQEKYRERFLEERKIYLYNIDVLFFMIDIQDSKRIEESLKLYQTIITSLVELNENPPVIVCLNKFDPDLKKSKEINKSRKNITEHINQISPENVVKIFNTSIFDQFSIISAYSAGLAILSPNREVFEAKLKSLSKKIHSDATLLINDNGIILSNYSKEEISGKVFEISAPHFQTLYKTFKEFRLLKKQDFLVSSGITPDMNNIVFKRILAGNYTLFLLFLIKNELDFTKIDKHLDKFATQMEGLIQTYI